MTTLSLGHRLTDPTEVLSTVTLSEVHHLIVSDIPLKTEVLRLRKLAQLDKTAYRSLKTRLPYVVGSVFDGGKRHTQHLLAAHFFIIDIDDCPLNDGTLQAQICQNESVALLFISPSDQGLKVFFPLDTPCTDAKLYAEAYRAFASRFAEGIRLEGSVDMRTSDAARACFLSHDSNAYFNPMPKAVQWQAYLSTSMLTFDHSNPLDAASTTVSPTDSPPQNPINEVAYQAVLRKINPNAPVRLPKQTHVPELLHQIEPVVREVCQENKLELVQVQPLNFGLKFMVRSGTRSAEVNVFYGKKGFSVVRSPKTGTDPTIADLLYHCIYNLLFPAEASTDTDYTLVVSDH
jgi:hypothetical protein